MAEAPRQFDDFLVRRHLAPAHRAYRQRAPRFQFLRLDRTHVERAALAQLLLGFVLGEEGVAAALQAFKFRLCGFDFVWVVGVPRQSQMPRGVHDFEHAEHRSRP